MERVYVSLPLTGPSGPLGRDVMRGAELALEQAEPADVEPVFLDAAGEDRDGRAAANAGSAARDPAAVAYLGDFHSSQVLASAPVLGAAGILAVAPVATFAGLRGETLVRLSPHDGVAAQAIARWMRARGDVADPRRGGRRRGRPRSDRRRGTGDEGPPVAARALLDRR